MPPPPLSSLVGSVVERSPGSSSSFEPVSTSSSGFPRAQHRSKSAFARATEAKRNGTRDLGISRTREVPLVRRTGSLLSSSRGSADVPSSLSNEISSSSKDTSFNSADEGEWKAQMRRDNERAIAAMSAEERERHAAEILEQLGPNVGELLQKAREARARVGVKPSTSEAPTAEEPRGRGKRDEPRVHTSRKESDSRPEIAEPTPIRPVPKNKFVSPPRSILSQPSSRASSPGRNARKLRFADVTEKDVHVYQSEPSSPRRPIGLLPPPLSGQDNSSKDTEMLPVPASAPEPQANPASKPVMEPEPEVGTPQYIRRHFFPDAPMNEPSLEWIEPVNSASAASDAEPRFDLSGTIIPVSVRATLPTYLGLHHHGGSSAAGYTLSDLYLLARSSVPAQRATVLGVLSKIVRRLARREDDVSEIKDRDDVRSKALVLGLAALTEKGTVGMEAIDLIWTCVVSWDEDEVAGLDGVELRPTGAKVNPSQEVRAEDSLPSGDPISSLPFSALLPQIVVLLDSQSLPQESRAQLLSILHRFARHSVEIATIICETRRLLASVVNTFLLTPIPPSEHGPLPNPLALDFLRTLALSSRANARTLEGPADALLRFITTTIPMSASPFPHPLADALLCGTLNLYAALGRYGLYSGVATTAAEHFTRLSSSILSSADENDTSLQLKQAWLRLLSVWMVCALDPHRTTPAHDLLWSQVTGWGWGDDLLEFRKGLISAVSGSDERLWPALWDALASWLEGCRVNRAKSGQEERETVNNAISQTWQGGVERALVKKTVAELKEELTVGLTEKNPDHPRRIAELCGTLASFTRLCLACLPKQSSELSGQDVAPWIKDAIAYMYQAISALLLSDVLRSIRRTSSSLRDDLAFRARVRHMREASSFFASFIKLSCLVRISTEWLSSGLATLQVLLPGDEESAQWLVGEIIDKECVRIECASKLQFLMPFYKNMIRPDDTFYLSPLSPTPVSIQHSTTQCLPANCVSDSSARPGVSGLPLSPEWPCIALDHLLRSGTSPILTNPNSVPDSWNASETDLVQASLSLMLHVQRTLNKSDFQEFAPSFEHVVFNCMKVFMLEHNQQQSDSSEEVFRDPTVGRLMDALLLPYTLRGSHSSEHSSFGNMNLEVVAKSFLGEGTPFFQFYTDFVALYDAISFSHPTFARLLLPPTSMAYPLDYRKLLWGDFGHSLRTIRTPIEDVPSLDLREFFWPVENDAEMLGWYLRALVKWPLDGFPRFVAVHHLASNIWPDLRQEEEATSESEREKRNKHSRMLLVAIFNQAKNDVVKDVVRYVQDGRDSLLLPPACYVCKEETKTDRLTFVRDLGETRIAESMEKIFAQQS